MTGIGLSSLFAVLPLVMLPVELDILLIQVVYHIRIMFAFALHITFATTFEFIFDFAYELERDVLHKRKN